MWFYKRSDPTFSYYFLLSHFLLPDLAVKSVMISSGQVKTDFRPKTMTVIVLNGPLERDTASNNKVLAGIEKQKAEERDTGKKDLQAVLINGHSYREALRSIPGECSTPW